MLCPYAECHFIYCYAERCYAEYHYAECQYAECRSAECCGAHFATIIPSKEQVLVEGTKQILGNLLFLDIYESNRTATNICKEVVYTDTDQF